VARTPDPIGDSLELPETGADPALVGELRLNTGALKGRDALGVFNLRSSASSLRMTHFDAIMLGGTDTVRGTVTGLDATPVRVAGFTFAEQIPVPSGLHYDAIVVAYTVNGFTYEVRVIDNEYWPGTTPLTLRVNYLWSDV
jgi:hypothetical protein